MDATSLSADGAAETVQRITQHDADADLPVVEAVLGCDHEPVPEVIEGMVFCPDCRGYLGDAG